MDLFGTTLDPEVAIVVKLGMSIALGGLAGPSTFPLTAQKC